MIEHYGKGYKTTSTHCCFCGVALTDDPEQLAHPDKSGMCNNCYDTGMENAPAVTWTARDIPQYAGAN